MHGVAGRASGAAPCRWLVFKTARTCSRRRKFDFDLSRILLPNMMLVHEELLRELQDFALTAPTAKSVMEHIAQHLHEKMTRYNWVGFYLVDPSEPGVLLVGPFV